MNVRCSCGSEWFRLEGGDIDTPAGPARALGAICVDKDGGVSGYSGILRCFECGEEQPSPFQRTTLRAV